LNRPLAMSAVALVGGLSLYFGLQRRIDLHQVIKFPRGGRELFAASLAALVAGARNLTWALQNGSLQRYLTLLVVFALAAGALPLLQRSEEHTSELQSRENLVCRLLLEKKKIRKET